MRAALAIALVACGDPAVLDNGRLDNGRLDEQVHAERAGPAERAAAPSTHAQDLDDLRRLERDVVTGRLAEAKTLASLLARPPDPWMCTWAADAARVEAAALAVAAAPDLLEACRDCAGIAVACARCHVAAERLPSEPPSPRPTEPISLHRWAVERVLDGLVDANDTPWRAGMQALADVDAPDAGLPCSAGVAAELAARARGDLAAPLDDLGARGSAYGELLLICAGCHSALGR